MALTPSKMSALGGAAPDFMLPDVMSGRTVTLSDFRDNKALLVMFICRHCPYVKHVEREIARIGTDYADSDVGIVAISANDPAGYPDDAPQGLREMGERLGFVFPYCYDESQDVAKAYQAACTPDFFLYDSKRKLVYRGQLDNSRPGNGVPVSGTDLRSAIDAVLSGSKVSRFQRPSMGCSIKWRPGNEPL